MNKLSYEILEHTADVGLKIYGRTLPEVFANAGRGLVALALAPQEVSPAERLPLSAQGADREDLLVNWLSEILYYLDAEGWVFCDFRIQRLAENAIEAEGLGQQLDPARHPRSVAIKAVTYHQISVRDTGEGWEAVVYFDI